MNSFSIYAIHRATTQFRERFSRLVGEDRFILKSAVGGLLYKIASIACGVATTAIAARLLGRDDLGIWLALTAVTSWISLADGGIGQSLLNRLSYYYGQNNQKDAISALWSGQWLQTFLVLALSVVILWVSLEVDFIHWIFPTRPENTDTIQQAFTILSIGTLVLLPLRNYTSVLISNRYVADNTTLLILQSVFLTGSALFALLFKLDIVGYSLAYLAAFYIIAIIGWIRVFTTHLPTFWKPLTLNFKVGLDLLKSGIYFALSSLALILNSSFDNLVLAKFYGPGAVVDYSFPVRLFGFTLILSMLAGGSLSSAYTQALGQRRIDWIRRRYRGSLIAGGVLSTVLCLLLLPMAKQIIRVWSVDTARPDMFMITSVAVWFIVTGFYQPTAFLMNGLYRAKDTLKVGIASVIINIPATLIGLKLFGPPGAPLGSAIAALLAGVLWSHHLCKRAIRDVELDSINIDSLGRSSEVSPL